jgi:hypothetical protein
MTSIHAKTIQTLRVSQRLLDEDLLRVLPVHFHIALDQIMKEVFEDGLVSAINTAPMLSSVFEP